MKIITSLKLLVVTLLFTLNYSGLFAQDGIIQGVITDEYGINVPGAAVMIDDLNKGAVSNQDGKFTFVEVPEGNHTLTIKYLGFADFTKEVMVTAGKTTSVSILLASEEMIDDSFVEQQRVLNSKSRDFFKNSNTNDSVFIQIFQLNGIK